ncbi:MAG: type IX secretion system outer membrane channel protein PorV [Bacteroidota bacterium]
MKKYQKLLGILSTAAFLGLTSAPATAQINTIGQNGGRVITSAVPFLIIAPDARASGMGDMGAATTADVNSIHWNPGKLAFVQDDIGLGISYTPWLAALNLTDDMSISYLSGFYKLSKERTIGVAMKYFDLGNFQETFDNGEEGQLYSPREFSFAATYSQMLTQYLSAGVSVRYARSQLLGNFSNSTSQAQAANTVAADVGFYYNRDIVIAGKTAYWSTGVSVSNLGPKVTYTDVASRDFIPSNFRLGTALTADLDPYNQFTVGVEVNKLMVPTPRERDPDTNLPIGTPVDSLTWLQGTFGSFSDAPDGFSEELSEFTVSLGAEYWYNKTFAARAGYFHEAATKGNRKYITLGLGFRYNVFGIDFAYLTALAQRHPLDDTLRFSLHFKFDNGKGDESITE